MKLRAESPHFSAIEKSGNWWTLAEGQLPNFRTAWMGGVAFWSGNNIWDEEVTIRLANIVGIVVQTADSIALRESEKAEEKSRGLLES